MKKWMKVIIVLGFNENGFMLNPIAGKNSTWMRWNQDSVIIKTSS